MFLKILQNSWKTTVLDFLISKVTSLGLVTSLKRDPNIALPFFIEHVFLKEHHRTTAPDAILNF